MSIPWSDHLDLARCLFHLQRDLLLETWEEQLPSNQLVAIANEVPEGSQMQTLVQTQPELRPTEPVLKLRSDGFQSLPSKQSADGSNPSGGVQLPQGFSAKHQQRTSEEHLRQSRLTKASKNQRRNKVVNCNLR